MSWIESRRARMRNHSVTDSTGCRLRIEGWRDAVILFENDNAEEEEVCIASEEVWWVIWRLLMWKVFGR